MTPPGGRLRGAHTQHNGRETSMTDILPTEIMALLRPTAAGKHAHASLFELEDAIGRHPALERRASSLFRCGGVQLRTGLRLYLDREVEALAAIRDLSLTTAPVVVELIELQPGEGALITRWPSCVTGKIRPPTAVSAAAKIAFAQDMQTLASAGFIHAYAGRGLQSVFIASDTGAIVLDDWGAALKRATLAERSDFLSGLDRQIAKLG